MRNQSLFPAALLAAFALAACSEAEKPASQVAARVNSSEISIHQVNLALRRIPGIPPEDVAVVKRRVLDELVDQELAVQGAVAAKLDRNPDVLQSIDAARREILARAFMDQVSAGATPPTDAEIATYYRQHPELFTERKIYHLHEVTLPSSPELLGVVRKQVAMGRSAAELQAWLKSRQAKVIGHTAVKPAEKVEMEILPRLAAMKSGQTSLFETPAGPTVITVLATFAEPMPEDEAKPLIERFLRRERSEALEKETARQLRTKANVEYLGEFKDAPGTGEQRKAAQAEPKAEPKVEQALDDPETAQTGEAKPAVLVTPSENAIRKGISGLD